MFQIVLYYKRRTIIPPPKPSVDDMVKKTAPTDTEEYDKILDIYNESLSKYNKVLEEYEKIKDNSIVNSFVIIDDDENFLDNVIEIENNVIFVEWDKHSLDLIKNKKKEKMETF
jgi:hypothetical protein